MGEWVQYSWGISIYSESANRATRKRRSLDLAPRLGENLP